MSFRHIFALRTDTRISSAQANRILKLLMREGLKRTELAPTTKHNINQPVRA